MTAITTREQVPHIARVGGAAAAPRAAAQAPGPAMTGRDILRVLRKRLWMIVLSLVICTALAAVATVLWGMYAPFFTAEAYLLVNPPKPSELTPTPGLYPKDIMERLVMSQARLVSSEAVLDRATKDIRLTNTEWYRDNRERAITELGKAIDVAPVQNTNFFRISMTGVARTDKERTELAEIVNSVAEAFVADSKENVGREFRDTISNLQKELTSLTDRRDRTRRDVSDIVRNSQIPNLEERRNILSLKLQALTQQLTQLEMTHSQAEAVVLGIQEQESRGLLEKSPDVIQMVESDPSMRGLRNAEAGLLTERDDLLGKLGEQHRSVLTVEARLASVRRQIDERQKEVVAMAVKAVKESREATLTAIKAQLMNVRTEYNAAMAGVRDLQATATALQQLYAEQQNLEININRIDARLVELRLLAQGQELVSLRRQATAPREPSLPKWSILMPVGVLLGLVVGLGLAVSLELIDTSVKGPADVTRRVDLPMLGMVPHIDDLDEEIENVPLAFTTHPNSLLGEAFRQIRTCLVFSAPAQQRRSLLVTSPMPQDGRGTVAMNLASALARGGRNVLIVDANFRQPMIRRLFPQCPQAGLSNALVGQSDWRDHLCQVEPTLTVLSCGPMPPSPAELLGSDTMRQILAEMSQEYDQVIFDGPPCLVVTDASVLSTVVDGVILVIRAGANTFGVIQRTRNMLQRVGAHILGVVLNGVRITAGGYFRKSYETFYEYQEQPGPQAEDAEKKA